ncbi:hypothetical protein [Candidatus Endoriftia persephone]|uniref:Uncharacterized protein n=3 Tax=Gammaproteobacteria TaxID=1236 RepID=G2FEI7_9GAMM|nr:hypothetical protein [Candidatus Endoriftia persephone]EGV51772.1 hypothetical protein Rifp1Sym_az00280 [endosymbiont of Riftia pachyptila (vent Ph05)]EGW54756.1 hypothetical protein TevJSym_ai00360 [endosymbiont of Tevnia jerichonana (vent Tica)]USF87277.1 hypothetical protein L0Y14_14250 [Candidatus Endoriftia persephone]
MTSTASLSLEQAPPISVPFRFFLTAPLFLLLASLLLMLEGAAVLMDRWSPLTLSMTHLFTLGVLGQVMMGAMLQMLPVLAGSPVPRVVPLATTVHLATSLGTLALVAGFLGAGALWMKLAVCLLAGGFTFFISGVGIALWRVVRVSTTVIAMRLAVLGLLVTVLLGLYLAAAQLWKLPYVDLIMLTNTHLAWGGTAWVGLLIVGVGYQVVPMFQLTPEYPVRLQRLFAPLLFAALLVWSLDYWSVSAASWLALLVGSGFMLFALVTLYLQHQRRRKLADVTLNFWRLGLGLVVLAWLLMLTRALSDFNLDLWLGVCLIFAVLSIINGMLYKIVPFLSWFHLQHQKTASLAGGGPRIPSMKELLPDRFARRQWYLHLLALLLWAGVLAVGDSLTLPAGLFLGLSSLLLCYNLVRVVLKFRHLQTELRAAAPAGAVDQHY